MLKLRLRLTKTVATNASPVFLGSIDQRRFAPLDSTSRLEGYLQRLCNLLYMGPLHPSSAHVAHLLQDFLGTTPRVETLSRLQKSRPERELRQALQVWHTWRSAAYIAIDCLRIFRYDELLTLSILIQTITVHLGNPAGAVFAPIMCADLIHADSGTTCPLHANDQKDGLPFAWSSPPGSSMAGAAVTAFGEGRIGVR